MEKLNKKWPKKKIKITSSYQEVQASEGSSYLNSAAALNHCV